MKISLITRLFDLVAPRRCRMCGSRLTPTEDVICTGCCLHLPRTDFAAAPTTNPMAQLFWGQMPVERAAALIYHRPHTASANIVYGIKYSGHTADAVVMGRMMGSELKPSGFFDDIDIIVPVPLTRKRRRARGYNQSELLARGISEATGIPVDTRAVVRTDFGMSQTNLTHRMRHDNVKDAFRLHDGKRLKNRHVLIVDDVATSGSTIIACGNSMTTVGGLRISVLTLSFTKG